MKTSVWAHVTGVQRHEQVSSGARRAKSLLYTKINRFTVTIFQEVVNSWQAVSLNVRLIGKRSMQDVWLFLRYTGFATNHIDIL